MTVHAFPAPTSPPPGWYADPWRLAALRWWDGTTWTADVHGAPDYAIQITTARPVPGAQPVSPAEGGEAGVRPGLAVAVAGVCIVAGLVYQAVVYGLTSSSRHSSSDYLLRRDLVIGLAFYVIVGGGLALFVRTQKVRLVWHRGSPLGSVTIGAVCGLTAGLLIVAANSAIVGRTASDPRVEMLVSEGGLIRIALTFVLTAVLAPLVEETLFRGVVAGSLTGRSVGLAVVVSAIAFSVWHLSPASLRYYAIMGVLIALIWLKRGLIASMTAHACFNGLLTAVAVIATQTGGTTIVQGPLAVRVPAGWHTVARLPIATEVTGPSGAGLYASCQWLPAEASRYDLRTIIDAGLSRVGSSFPDGSLETGSERTVATGVGDGVEIDLQTPRGIGHVVFVRASGQVCELTVATQGSPRADEDFTRMVRQLSQR